MSLRTKKKIHIPVSFSFRGNPYVAPMCATYGNDPQYTNEAELATCGHCLSGLRLITGVYVTPRNG